MLAQNRSIPDATIMPELPYPEVAAAVNWLCDRFGLVERLRIGDHRAQLTYGAGAVIVTDRAATVPATGHAVMMRIADVTAHHRRAVQKGVRVLHAPADHPFGERQYVAEDLGGHRWTFTQTIADIEPADWGGELRANA